jgi:hypothetical protein
MSLFGNHGKTKEEIKLQQFKEDLENVVGNLQEAIKIAPSRDNINNLCTYTRSKLKNSNECFNDIGKKVRAVENHVKINGSLIGNVHKKTLFMSKLLVHDGSLIKYEEEEEEKQAEAVKMLSDTITESLLDLDKCCFNEPMNIFQNFATDPYFNVHQTGFGSYIANHVIKENIKKI